MKIKTVAELNQEVVASKTNITFDGEFYQAEPLEYPYDAECFGARSDAEAWIDSEADKIRTRLEAASE